MKDKDAKLLEEAYNNINENWIEDIEKQHNDEWDANRARAKKAAKQAAEQEKIENYVKKRKENYKKEQYTIYLKGLKASLVELPPEDVDKIIKSGETDDDGENLLKTMKKYKKKYKKLYSLLDFYIKSAKGEL